MNRRVVVMLILAACTGFLSGCATTSLNEVAGPEMSSSLKACDGRLTKAELMSQAGPPTAREGRNDGGEVWVYVYKDQKTYTTKDNVVYMQGQSFNLGGGKTETYNYEFRVTIGFDARGIMDDWRYNGSLKAAPDNPFRTLTSSAPPKLTLEEQENKLAAVLLSACNSHHYYKPDLFQQVGAPTRFLHNNEYGGDTWVYVYESGQEGMDNYRSVTIKPVFNKEGRFSKCKYSGHLLTFPDIPFYHLKDPGKVPGVWVSTKGTEPALILFDAFSGLVATWEGETAGGAAHGTGAAKVMTPRGKDVGCYIGNFQYGRCVGTPEFIRNPEYRAKVPGLSLGGVSW